LRLFLVAQKATHRWNRGQAETDKNNKNYTIRNSIVENNRILKDELKLYQVSYRSEPGLVKIRRIKRVKDHCPAVNWILIDQLMIM